MPRASHRLDVLRVPADLEAALDEGAWAALLSRWQRLGAVVGSGPGPAADLLIEGGFRRLWLDQRPRLSLFVNQQGGFRARCPQSGALITAAFSQALQAWREGGPRALRCPSCSEPHALEQAALEPPGAFARWAIVWSDAGSAALSAEAEEALARALGPLRPVLRRVG